MSHVFHVFIRFRENVHRSVLTMCEQRAQTMKSAFKTEWTRDGRPCTHVNISWHSPWRHIEEMNRPETNAQRRKNTSQPLGGIREYGVAWLQERRRLLRLRFNVVSCFGLLRSCEERTDVRRRARSNKWNDRLNNGTATTEWKKINRRQKWRQIENRRLQSYLRWHTSIPYIEIASSCWL